MEYQPENAPGPGRVHYPVLNAGARTPTAQAYLEDFLELTAQQKAKSLKGWGASSCPAMSKAASRSASTRGEM
eukprot:15472443-Alexandrium_andersonii.AAC.1